MSGKRRRKKRRPAPPCTGCNVSRPSQLQLTALNGGKPWPQCDGCFHAGKGEAS